MSAVGAARARTYVPPPAPRRNPQAPAVEPRAKRAAPPPITNVALPTNPQTSFSDRLIEIVQTYNKVTGGKVLNPSGIRHRLKVAFERCKREKRPFTRQDFEKAFDTSITEQAWKAFGGSAIYSERGLLSAFEHYEGFYIATNANFEYFRGCTEITITPAPHQMRGFVARNRKLIFSGDYSNEAKRILTYLRDGRGGYKNTLKGKKLAAKLTRHYNGLSTENKKKFNRLMAAALFNKLYLYALKKKLPYEVLKGLHRDSLLSRIFTKTLFAKFVKGPDVKKADFEAFGNRVKTINGLRSKVGKKHAGMMDDFIPGSTEFKDLVSDYKSGKSATKLREFIDGNLTALKNLPPPPQPTAIDATPVRVPKAPPKAPVATKPAPAKPANVGSVDTRR